MSHGRRGKKILELLKGTSSNSKNYKTEDDLGKSDKTDPSDKNDCNVLTTALNNKFIFQDELGIVQENEIFLNNYVFWQPNNFNIVDSPGVAPDEILNFASLETVQMGELSTQKLFEEVDKAAEKYKDLKELCKSLAIEAKYHIEYLTLRTNNTVPDVLPESDMEDLDD